MNFPEKWCEILLFFFFKKAKKESQFVIFCSDTLTNRNYRIIKIYIKKKQTKLSTIEFLFLNEEKKSD